MTTETGAIKPANTPFPLPAFLKSTAAFLLFLALAAVALWGLSFATWGVPGLYLPAVAMVPVIMVTLLLVTRG